MKNSEEAIEKVFAGLRDVDTPAGLERRIVETIQDRAFARSRWNWRRLIVRTPLVVAGSGACGVALIGIFAFILATSAVHRREHVPTSSKRNAAPLAVLPPSPSEAVAESAPLLEPRPTARLKEKVNLRRAGFIRDDGSAALREMRAPSRPEPPMPLTEQEKLLVRFVQTRRPEELAAINPVKWAARDAAEEAEFEKFFGQKTTGDKE
jgi:cell division protein FtsN